jgi:hypothetical protein
MYVHKRDRICTEEEYTTSTGHEKEILVHVDAFIDLPSPQVLVVLLHST